MFLIYLFLIILAMVCIAGIIVICKKMQVSLYITIILIIIGALCFSFILSAGIIQANSHNINKTNIARFEELTTYYNIVSNSKDEAVRFNYYQKVLNWNEEIIEYALNRENQWVGAFYGYMDYEDCYLIPFTLNSGSGKK